MGHVGAGHVHSHSGFVQDDCAGFATAAAILRQAFPVSTIIADVNADPESGLVTVTLEGGETGTARPRRGITPFEADLTHRAIGMDALFSQQATLTAFGRIYGQGCMELPVAFQTALCLAVVHAFEMAHPDAIFTCEEALPGQVGRCAGAVVDIDGVPVSLMAVINATGGGLGPNEDLEGNIPLGPKGDMMIQLGLDRLPTVILETKAYAPAACQHANTNFLWIRANKESDNTCVWQALVHGAQQASIPYEASDLAYPRGSGDMADLSQQLGQDIADLGKTLASAETAAEKVAIIGDLALKVSQDAGGVTFMSNALNDVVGGGGLLPGTSAVLAMGVCPEEIRHWKVPVFTDHDAELYLKTLSHAVPYLATQIKKARQEVADKANFNALRFKHLIQD